MASMKTFAMGMTVVALVGWSGMAGAALPAGQGAEARPIELGRKLTPDQVQALTGGSMRPGSTIHVPAGYELPIEIGMHGDLAGTVDPVTPVKLKARRDLWIKFTGEDVQASLDGVHYKPVSQLFTGSVSFALSAGEDGSNLRGAVSAEIRVRGGDM